MARKKNKAAEQTLNLYEYWESEAVEAEIDKKKKNRGPLNVEKKILEPLGPLDTGSVVWLSEYCLTGKHIKCKRKAMKGDNNCVCKCH